MVLGEVEELHTIMEVDPSTGQAALKVGASSSVKRPTSSFKVKQEAHVIVLG